MPYSKKIPSNLYQIYLILRFESVEQFICLFENHFTRFALFKMN